MISQHRQILKSNLKSQNLYSSQQQYNKKSFLLKNQTQKEQFEQLEIRTKRMKEFIQQLGQYKQKQIPQHFLKLFQRDPSQLKGVDANFVLKEIVKRVQKMKKNQKIKRNWSSTDIKILTWTIFMSAQKHNVDLISAQNDLEFWQFIASLIPGTTPQSCLFKWLSQRKYKITTFSWNSDEQQLLIDLQKKYTDQKNKWKLVSEQLYLKNPNKQKIFRQPKQCRQHYTSFLDPNVIKGPWSKQEDYILLNHLIQNRGQKKWCKLVKILSGRTENAIKNRYQLILSKLLKKKQNKNKNQFEIILDYIRENYPDIEIRNLQICIEKQRKQLQINPVKVQNECDIECNGQNYGENEVKIKQQRVQNKIKIQRSNQAISFQRFQQNVKNLQQQKISVVKQQFDSSQQWYHFYTKQPSAFQSFRLTQNQSNDSYEKLDKNQKNKQLNSLNKQQIMGTNIKIQNNNSQYYQSNSFIFSFTGIINHASEIKMQLEQ